MDLEHWRAGQHLYWRVGGPSRDWILIAQADPATAAVPYLVAVPPGREAPALYGSFLRAGEHSLDADSLPPDGARALDQLAPLFGQWWFGEGRFLARDNPRPREWSTLPPNTHYKCHSWERKIVGKKIPGRNGGKVTGCATPAEPVDAKKRRAQVVIDRERLMPRQRAANRLRNKGKKLYVTPFVDVEAAATAYLSGEYELPSPIGMVYPHRLSKCDGDHPVWEGYPEAYEDASERAAIAVEGGASEDWAEVTHDILRLHPRYADWVQATRDCAESFRRQASLRKPKATFSTAREAARRRQDAIAQGVDVTSAEYFDTLGGGEGRRRRGKR